MGRRKKKQSVLNSEEFEDLVRDIKVEEPERLTIYCPTCDYDLWSVTEEALASSVSFRDGGLDIGSMEPLQKAQKPSTVVPLFCFLCGEQVFRNRYYGGFEVSTREKGKFPNGPVRGPGIRIPNPSGFPRR